MTVPDVPDARLLSRREAAERMGVSVPTLDRYKDTGAFPYYKVGRRVLIDSEELDAFIAKRCRRVHV